MLFNIQLYYSKNRGECHIKLFQTLHWWFWILTKLLKRFLMLRKPLLQSRRDGNTHACALSTAKWIDLVTPFHDITVFEVREGKMRIVFENFLRYNTIVSILNDNGECDLYCCCIKGWILVVCGLFLLIRVSLQELF